MRSGPARIRPASARVPGRLSVGVRGERCERFGRIPDELAPEQLFPGLRQGGRPAEQRGPATALAAIARTFGVTLPRFALAQGRLHSFTTRSWTRPPGPGEACIAVGL
ncbi:hypothetical protein [Streptomyces flavofungini]|uniref:hypothetical protein n=1 Tax=Streptomyces flavofungini TaxID=68200 RepID=UPI0034DEACAC